MAFSFAVVISIVTITQVTPHNSRPEFFEKTSLKLNWLATLTSDLKIVFSSQKGNVSVSDCCIRLFMSKDFFPIKTKTERIPFLDTVQISRSRINILFK